MDKTYVEVNTECVPLPTSGGSSSMGSQWDAGLDLDEARSIITSSLRKIGCQNVPKAGAGEPLSGALSLEEEVDSLDLIHLSINDEELEELKKQEVNSKCNVTSIPISAAATTTAAAAVAASKGKQPDMPESKAADWSKESARTAHRLPRYDEKLSEKLSEHDDILDDISSVMESNGWMGVTKGYLDDVRREKIDTVKVFTLNNGGTEGRQPVKHEYETSPSIKTTPSPMHIEQDSPLSQNNYQQSPSPSYAKSDPHHFVKSPLSVMDSPLPNSRHDPSDECQLNSAHPYASRASPFSSTPQAPENPPRHEEQQGQGLGKGVDRSSAAGDGSRNAHSTHDALGPLDVVESETTVPRAKSAPCQPSQNPAAELDSDAASLAVYELDTGCQMCPLEYDGQDDDVDVDEHYDSGELIPHGRGRPKTVRPVKPSTPREIRPKSASIIPSYPVNVRQDVNKIYLEVCSNSSQSSHRACQSPDTLSLGIPSVVNEALNSPLDGNSQQLDSAKSSSMECVEGDSPISFTNQPYIVSGKGRLPHVLASEMHHRPIPTQKYTAIPPQRIGQEALVFTQATQRRQLALGHTISQPTMQQIDLAQLPRDVVYQDKEPQYRAIYPPEMMISYGNDPRLHRDTGRDINVVQHQPAPVTTYKVSRPEPPRMVTSYVQENPTDGTNLVLADRKQLEQAGIPYIPNISNVIATQSSAASHSTPLESIAAQKQFVPIKAIEQPYVSQVVDGWIYRQMPASNLADVRLVEERQCSQTARPTLPVQYRNQPQHKPYQGHYVGSPSVSGTHRLEPSNQPGSNVVYCKVPPQHNIPTSAVVSQSRVMPEVLPRDDKIRRTQTWISSIPSHQDHGGYESHAHHQTSGHAGQASVAQGKNNVVVRLFGNDIPVYKAPGKAGSKAPTKTVSSKNVGSTRDSAQPKVGNKGRPSRKEKTVDTNNSHQGYIKNQLAENAELGELLNGQTNVLPGLGNRQTKPRSDDLLAEADEEILKKMNALKNGMTGQTKTPHGRERTNGEKDVTSSVDNLARVDKEFNQIRFEAQLGKKKGNGFVDSMSVQTFAAMYDQPCLDYSSEDPNQRMHETPPPALVRDQNVSLEKPLPQPVIDSNQYMCVEDKESLEKNTDQQQSSLDRYLMSANPLSSVDQYVLGQEMPQAVGLTAPREENSMLLESLGTLDHHPCAQPPKEMAKIDILSWTQQTGPLGHSNPSPMLHSHLNNPQLNTANPNADCNFSQMLPSMSSSSLELISSCIDNEGQRFTSPQVCLAKDVNTTHIGSANIQVTPGQDHQQQRSSRNSGGIPAGSSIQDADKICAEAIKAHFMKPWQPTVKHSSQGGRLTNITTYEASPSYSTALTASRSYAQPLMFSNAAMPSCQPMSSGRGDSDVSMQSDLSRQSGRDRSMSRHPQSQQFYQSGNHSDVKSVIASKEDQKPNRTEEWVAMHYDSLYPSNVQHERQTSSRYNLQNTHLNNTSTATAIPNIPKSDNLDLPQRNITQINQQQLDFASAATQQRWLLQNQQQQQQQVLQNIPSPPSIPLHKQGNGTASPFRFLDSQITSQELDDDENRFVVPGFSPTDLLPREGGSSSQTITPPSSSTASAPTSGTESKLASSSSTVSVTTSTVSSTLVIPLSPSTTPFSSSSKVTPVICSSRVSNGAISHTHLSSSQKTTSVINPGTQVKSTTVNNSIKDKIAIPLAPTSSGISNDVVIVGETKLKTNMAVQPLRETLPNQIVPARLNEEGGGVEEEEEDDSFTGSDVFSPDENGETLLHCLCDMPREDLEALSTVPGFTEALNTTNKAQETALFVGVRNCRPDVASFLIKQGADVSVSCISPRNSFRSETLLQSALHEAAELGDAKTLKILLQSNIDKIDIRRHSSGQTPLMVALHVHSLAHRNPAANRTKVVRLLLNNGPSLTVRDAVEGKTPFMYAVQSRDVDMVKYFLHLMQVEEARQSVTAKTSRSYTCLHYAASLKLDRKKKVELIHILIMAGADPHVRNAEGESPRDWAHEEITEVYEKLKKRT